MSAAYKSVLPDAFQGANSVLLECRSMLFTRPIIVILSKCVYFYFHISRNSLHLETTSWIGYHDLLRPYEQTEMLHPPFLMWEKCVNTYGHSAGSVCQLASFVNSTSSILCLYPKLYLYQELMNLQKLDFIPSVLVLLNSSCLCVCISNILLLFLIIIP